jgi:hypothetical protein
MRNPVRFTLLGWSFLFNTHWDLIGLRTHLPRRDRNQQHITLFNMLLLGCELSWFKRHD